MAKKKTAPTKATKTTKTAKTPTPRPAPAAPAAPTAAAPTAPAAASTEVPLSISVNGQPVTILLKIDVTMTVVTTTTSAAPRRPSVLEGRTAATALQAEGTEIAVADVSAADLAPSGIAVTQVGGGEEIIANGFKGTVTVGCWAGTDDDPDAHNPVLLTAGHVVGGALGMNQPVTVGGVVVGTVKNVLPDRDAALIALAPGFQPVLNVTDSKTGEEFQVFGFSIAPVENKPVFMVGAVSGTVHGKILKLRTNKVVVSDLLSGQEERSLQGMMEIESTDGESFGVHGDSGSPVLQESNTPGEFNVVGILIAVEEGTGLGYADRLAGVTGIADALRLKEAEEE